tara:strand:- start:4181 stop:5236 length:1056 start_codon:yes stop_codon:yes gene_type:complete
MNDYEINDVRTCKDFKSVTFSNFKKCDVKKQLLNDMFNGKIENSCYWSTELICAGHFMELWEIILLYTCKFIHLGNPTLPVYINLRFKVFKEIVTLGYVNNELAMRNNIKIRKLFNEIICVLCTSIKKHAYETIKVKNEDFNMSILSEKLKAPSVHYIDDIFQQGDPKEFFIPLNEFAYCIHSDCKQSVLACYWIEWILEFENFCKKKKEVFECNTRNFPNVHNKFQKDIIWLVWECILHQGTQMKPIIQKILRELLDLFSLKFSHTCKKRRKFCIYFATALLCEHVNTNINLFTNKHIIENINKHTHLQYKKLKVNEQTPNTDYLFNNVKTKSNLEKTIDKLDILNKINI